MKKRKDRIELEGKRILRYNKGDGGTSTLGYFEKNNLQSIYSMKMIFFYQSESNMNVDNSTDLNSLRQEAEELFENKYSGSEPCLDNTPGNNMGFAEFTQLLHELQVKQIELKIQNTELKVALQKAESAGAIYDIASAGYLTFSKEGVITQLNHYAAKLIGKERGSILGNNFRQFIAATSKPTFGKFLRQVFKTHSPQSCELKLAIGEECFRMIRMEGSISGNEDQCSVTAIDITEQKKQEEILKQTQSNLIALFNNRDESIWLVNNNYQLVTFNNIFRDECFAAFDVELKEGMNILNIYPRHLSQLWKQKYARAMSGRRVIFEYSNKVGDEVHDYEVFLNPVVTDKKVTGVTALSVIVTWRNQAEEALRRSEERHRLLADNASDVISIMDIEGHITFISPSIKKLSGYTPEEFTNFSFQDIYAHESAVVFESNLKAIRHVMQLGDAMQEFRNEFQQWRNDGSLIWVEVTTSLMHNKCGDFMGILCVSRDINERKIAEQALIHSETKYRTLYESIIDGFAYINMEGQIIDCNVSFEQMVGYSREELVKLNFSNIIPEKWHAHERCIREEQIIPNGYSQVYQEEFIRKDGTIIPVELRIFVVKNRNGENERMCAIVRDITEQSLMQEALTKSEKLYHALFEKSNAVMFLIDPNDGIIVDANTAASRYYGYTHETLIGLNISDINMLPQSQIINSMHDVIAGKKLRYSFRHKLANMTIRDVEVNACPIEIDGRTLVHSIVHDITDRKLAEEALMASEARFRNLLQNVTAVAVQGYSPDGRIQYWNHAAELLYGYSAQEAIGRNIVKLLFSPEMQDDMLKAINQMVESGIPVPSTEMSLLRRNGSRVDVYTSHAIVQVPGRAPELFCFDIDLTERKKAQEKVRESDEIFRQFLENSPIYISFKDDHLRLMQMSRNYESLFGKKMEELIGKTIKEIYSPAVADSLDEDDLRILKEGIKIEGEEEILGRYFSSIKFPVQLPGKAAKIAGFKIDITERKRAELAIKESETRLQELNATKDKFFSIIAHDLKGPFNSIMGFSELLIRQIQERDYEGIGRYATIIQNSSQRAMNLLMNLLEWSRSQTGSIDFKPQEIAISVLVYEAAQLFYDAAQQKSLVIYIQIQQEIKVKVDRPMISTILRNLISNAIKFTHPGGEIIISVELIANECQVVVSDNGVGIKQEAIEKLFRIDASYSTVGTNDEVGTGLGLILCKDFVDKHKGRIWVESERGSKFERGTTKFYFTIPMGKGV